MMYDTMRLVTAELEKLKARLAEVYDLSAAAAVLSWDQETFMPPGGAEARAQQIATLGRLAHEIFTSDEVGYLLDELKAYESSLPFDSNEASLIRVARREYDRQTRVPGSFVERRAETQAKSYEAWVQARRNADFGSVVPWLEQILDLSREYSSFFPDLLSKGAAHIADPLIDAVDHGMSALEIRRIFAELASELVPLVEMITAQPTPDDSCLKQYYPIPAQFEFALRAAEQLGYDLKRGRQDQTAHPFMVMFAIDDVRITTRAKENDLTEALFSTLHEAGHAIYSQAIDHALARSLLADGASSGMHESQSRLWENLVGRSRGFWEYMYPQLREAFPAQLGSVSLDCFYRAINKVERSLIRTDADEVTYNLHVMMRFEFELELLEGKLAVRDLPEAWNEGMRQRLGITPPNDALGVLQDVHWYGGAIGGMFQGYTLGNLASAQLFEAAVKAYPEIPEQIRHGEFGTLRSWLTENLYRHGAKFLPDELIQRATGAPLSSAPFIRYLRNKYGELYQLQ